MARKDDARESRQKDLEDFMAAQDQARLEKPGRGNTLHPETTKEIDTMVDVSGMGPSQRGPDFLRTGDVDEGFTSKILKKPRLINTKFGEKLVIEITHNNEPRTVVLNKSSILGLSKELGNDSDKWEGKEVSIAKEKTMIKGERKWLLVVEPA